MDPNRDPRKVQSLEEEMAAMGLNPNRTLSAMTRGCELLDEGSHPMDLSGLPAGSEDVPRTIAQVGRALREDVVPEGSPSTEAELEEAFKMVRKLIKTAAEKMGARRAYRKTKGKAKRYAKQYYKRFKRKISKSKKRLRARFGGEAGLKKARAGGKKRIQRAGLDLVSTLREELERAEAALAESQAETTQDTDSTEMLLSPFEEAAIKSGLVLMHVGECFDDVQADVAAAMFNLSDAAADLAEIIEGAEEISSAQEEQLERLFFATAKALKAHESIGSPSLVMVYEAIEYAEVAINEGTDKASDKLVEHLTEVGAEMPSELAAWVISGEISEAEADGDGEQVGEANGNDGDE